MNEEHYSDIEKVLLYISEARQRADKVSKDLKKAGAEPHLAAAVEDAERQLHDTYRELMQSTYFAVNKTKKTTDVGG